MADFQRTIAARLRISSEGEPEIFGRTAEEVERLDEAVGVANRSADALGKAFASASKAVEDSSPRAESAVKKLLAAIEQERTAILEAQKAGAPVTPQQLQLLERAEQEYKDLASAAGRISVAGQQAKRDLDDAAEAAGGVAPRISSLDDLVRELTEDLGPGAVKWLSWGTAAAGALTAGYAAGTKLREVLNELTGGEFDKFFQEWTHLRAVTEAWVGAVDDAATEAQRLKNELNVLAKNGVDVAGLSAEQAHARYEQFSAGLRENRKAVNEIEAAYVKFKSALPPVGAELDKLAKQQAEFIRRFAEENKQLSQLDLAHIFGDMVNKTLAELARLRQKAPEDLQALATAWKLAGEAAKASAEQQVQAAGLIPEKLKAARAEVQLLVDTYRAAEERVPAILALQADALGIQVEGWARIRAAVDLTTGSIEGGAAGLAAYNVELERAVTAAEGANAAAAKLQQTLEGVGQTAHLAAGEVLGVFLGTPQVAGAAQNQVGYDPLHIDS